MNILRLSAHIVSQNHDWFLIFSKCISFYLSYHSLPRVLNQNNEQKGVSTL